MLLGNLCVTGPALSMLNLQLHMIESRMNTAKESYLTRSCRWLEIAIKNITPKLCFPHFSEEIIKSLVHREITCQIKFTFIKYPS